MTLEFFDLAFAITLLWTMLSPLSFTLPSPNPPHLILLSSLALMRL